MSDNSTYDRLIESLDAKGARYRLIDHPPEGRTELVSPMRGNELRHAAKCMIIMLKQGKKVTKYILAVIPGDRRVDLNAIKRLRNGTYASFATPEIAERLAGCVVGTVLPFSFSADLELIVDPALLEDTEELFFNAARLDLSMALQVDDYVAIAQPTFENISQE